MVTYEIEVYIGDVDEAETEENLYIHLFGTRGDSGRRILYKSEENEKKFQKGQMDSFKLEAVSLYDLTRIVIGHENRSKGKVKVKQRQQLV